MYTAHSGHHAAQPGNELMPWVVGAAIGYLRKLKYYYNGIIYYYHHSARVVHVAGTMSVC